MKLRLKKRIILGFFLILFSRIFANEKQINDDLSYFKEIYTQAYAGYEYEKELGFNIDNFLDNVRTEYYKQCNLSENINSEKLCSIMISILQKTKKIKDMHFSISYENQFYKHKSWLWNYSNIFFEKQGNDYICVLSYYPEIKKGQKYTGNKENLFDYKPFINSETVWYRFGLLSDKWEEIGIISIDKKSYKIQLYGNNPFHYKEQRVGIRSTPKSIYISFSGFLFESENKSKYQALQRQLNEYAKKIRESHAENLIIDLRGNFGGYERSFYSFLRLMASGTDYTKQKQFDKKIKSIYNGDKQYYSTIINQKKDEFFRNNPGLGEQNTDKELSTMNDVYYTINQEEYYYFEPDFKGRIIIIMDRGTASAAELFIMESNIFNNSILIGTNTYGCLDFSGVYNYTLPNSNIIVSLSNSSFKEMSFLQNNSHWYGDEKGFYPDYWVPNSMIINELVNITGDKKLKKELRGLATSQLYD